MEAESDERLGALFDAVASALVGFDGRLAELAAPLSETELRALVKRCRREAHPEPGDNHNFPVPSWDFAADLLERELRFRSVVDELVREEEDGRT